MQDAYKVIGLYDYEKKIELIYEISTNDDTLLDGSVLTVNGKTYDLTGNVAIVKIYAEKGMTYKATVSDREGYISPIIPSYTANPTVPSKRIVAEYRKNVAYIEVKVLSEDGSSPTNVSVTVGNQTKTYDDGLKYPVFEVLPETEYLVSVGEWVGGKQPESKTVKSGAFESRTVVEMTYTQMPVKGKAFNDYTPAELKQISDKEAWNEYNFKVGDRHAIKLTGNVNGVNLTGTWYAMIIGFNHNAEKEGKGITLQFANDTLEGGNNLAFWSYQMNTSYTNVGGWKNSIMRTKTCAEFFNALPKEWQDIIKITTKYTDNQGGGNDNNPITATEDKIFLLAENEVYSKKGIANSHERNYQLQYDYYKSGNSKIRYNHASTGSAVYCWLRSPYYDNGFHFCLVYSDRASYHELANYSYGFAPAFVI